MSVSGLQATRTPRYPAPVTDAEQLDLPVVRTRPQAAAWHAAQPPRPAAPVVQRQLQRWGATPVFDAYWWFAVQRQQVLMRRLAGAAPPWTADWIIARHRFTNPYRFTDRVSQDLLCRVQYDRDWDGPTLVLRTLLFKIFNRSATWSRLLEAAGEPTTGTFDPACYGRVLSDLRARGHRIYSAAYIVPNPPFGQAEKHLNHLRLLDLLLTTGVVDRLVTSSSLHDLYETLLQVPSFGPFLAFQYAVDLNYTPITQGGESGFVVAGPGARDGLRKCFTSLPAGAEADAILWVAETQDEHLTRLGLHLDRPFGRRLQPIDCQNLFCEIDKYARVAFPHIIGVSGRSRIKQSFRPTARAALPPLFCPPKWHEVNLQPPGDQPRAAPAATM